MAKAVSASVEVRARPWRIETQFRGAHLAAEGKEAIDESGLGEGLRSACG